MSIRCSARRQAVSKPPVDAYSAGVRIDTSSVILCCSPGGRALNNGVRHRAELTNVETAASMQSHRCHLMQKPNQPHSGRWWLVNHNPSCTRAARCNTRITGVTETWARQALSSRVGRPSTGPCLAALMQVAHHLTSPRPPCDTRHGCRSITLQFSVAIQCREVMLIWHHRPILAKQMPNGRPWPYAAYRGLLRAETVNASRCRSRHARSVMRPLHHRPMFKRHLRASLRCRSRRHARRC